MGEKISRPHKFQTPTGGGAEATINRRQAQFPDIGGARGGIAGSASRNVVGAIKMETSTSGRKWARPKFTRRTRVVRFRRMLVPVMEWLSRTTRIALTRAKIYFPVVRSYIVEILKS